MKLEDKICIITGAASGIGRASALLFARVGGTVIVADVNEAEGKKTVTDIQSEGGKASFHRTDVSRADEVESLVEHTVSAHGRVDVLFNNAGVDYMGPLHGMSEEDWDRVIDINLKGTFLGVKYAIPHMRRRKGGTILSTASVAGLVGSSGLGAYNAAKGGVVLLTKHLAVEYGRFGIRANCLCPGVIETPMTRDAARDRGRGGDSRRDGGALSAEALRQAGGGGLARALPRERCVVLHHGPRAHGGRRHDRRRPERRGHVQAAGAALRAAAARRKHKSLPSGRPFREGQ